ncbi:class I glutamine amidotransferase-like protein [Macroventuria anomochaeta]|uniref:Class I glutamine amidotransferase-like protein n=1 Tax=Macroventuria anomochaeta TaxID=301207 RepID=A0ACB6RMT5_9PLEO|nr:class I glutamine amidotransferase-like protein [Macroventuria anomochaeta]KAF2622617.1 class I glutamine amidotransferase-like protein [Macroventuria anomochaeta]
MRVSTLMPLFAALPSAFAAPQQPEFTNTTELPTHFAMLLLPRFQALDVFGPLDVLNTLSMLYSNKTAMTLTLLSKTMDPVSTTIKDINGKSNFGEEILPTNTFANILGKEKSHPAPTNHTTSVDKDIEVLLVPGGGGTRQNMTEEIAFVKEVYPKLKYIISICTGATVLSRAGILDGKKATTNKRSWLWATSTGPNVTWVPSARWVEDGNIFTSSGISAGIDVTMAWVGKIYGEEVADFVANSMEYERWTDPHRDPFAKVWDVPGAV